MEPADHLAALHHSAAALLTAASGNLERPVPSCPGWTLADLVQHMGLVWEWAAAVVESGERAERGTSPADRSDPVLLPWAGQHAARLEEVLAGADPDSGCWTFGPPPTRRFWFRRQALETVLHAWDAQRATGRAEVMDPAVAADGVDELLTVIVARRLAQDPGRWDGESVHLHRTDGEGEWTVRLGPGGTSAVEHGHGKADMALRGPAESLWLWCTNRVPLAELPIECFGDAGLADRWTAEITF
jgi:uncharacterized protein (TIGR03083 family)